MNSLIQCCDKLPHDFSERDFCVIIAFMFFSCLIDYVLDFNILALFSRRQKEKRRPPMFNVCFSRAPVCRIVFDLSARADRVSSGSFTSPLFCFLAVHSVGMNGLFTTTTRLNILVCYFPFIWMNRRLYYVL